MNVLVTGGAGYIGLVLIPKLLENGYKVKCLDVFFFGEESLQNLKINQNLTIIKDDTRKFNPEILKDVDVVVDLAAISQPDPTKQLDPNLFYEFNFYGPSRVVDLSKKHGVKKYILASTCSVYGFQDKILDENSPPNPVEIYGQTKAQAEKKVLSYSDKNFSVTVLRFATVYGLSPKMRFDLVVNGMTLSLFKTGKIRVMRNGYQWRPVVHVKDVVKAIMLIIESEEEKVNGEIFNVGSNNQNFQIYPLAKLIGDSVGEPYDIEWYGDPDTRSYRVSFEKIEKVLGYKTSYTPKEGAKEIYEALQNGKIMDTEKAYVIKWYKNLFKDTKF